MNKNKLNIIGLLIFSYFMTVEICYDMGSDKYKEDIVGHWYLHLSIMLTGISLVLRALADTILIKLLWAFFAACAANWAFRFYFNAPNVINWNEYFWAAIYLISIPIMFWWEKKKRQKKKLL